MPATKSPIPTRYYVDVTADIHEIEPGETMEVRCHTCCIQRGRLVRRGGPWTSRAIDIARNIEANIYWPADSEAEAIRFASFLTWAIHREAWEALDELKHQVRPAAAQKLIETFQAQYTQH